MNNFEQKREKLRQFCRRVARDADRLIASKQSVSYFVHIDERKTKSRSKLSDLKKSVEKTEEIEEKILAPTKEQIHYRKVLAVPLGKAL
jgi:glutamate formiminotransferase